MYALLNLYPISIVPNKIILKFYFLIVELLLFSFFVVIVVVQSNALRVTVINY